MLKNILRFNTWKIMLAAGVAFYYIKAVQTAISRGNMLTAVCLAPFCVLIFIGIVISAVVYFVRLFKLNVHKINSDIKMCKKCLAGCHYFFGDYLITMEIPAKIYFMEISEVYSYNNGRFFYIDIRTESGRKYTLKQFSGKCRFIGNRNDSYDTCNQMINLMLTMNGSIRLKK
ncbi:MAG: hypothetical protein IJZ72_08375 [Oscillospiraceae bacterium]|nr:hypothetical protein [Oscillospiraceae bacterium]